MTWNEDGVLNGARHITLAGHYAYIAADAGPGRGRPRRSAAAAPRRHRPARRDARASALQFRYLWVTDAEGLKLFDVTHLDRPVPVPAATVPLADARRIYLARTYAYVAAKARGAGRSSTSPIPSVRGVCRSSSPSAGAMNDVEDVVVASTNASLFAYVADGRNGMKVIQLTSPGEPAQFLRLLAARRSPS